MWDEITYISNFIPHFTGHVITKPCWLSHVSKRGPWEPSTGIFSLGYRGISHYNDVMMSVMASQMSMSLSQITNLTIVYLTVYLGADQRNIKAPRHWPLWGEFTGDRWIPDTKGQWHEKCFHLMTSSWYRRYDIHILENLNISEHH